MEKLQKVNKLLELIQNDTLTQKDVAVLLTSFVNILKAHKDSVDKDNEQMITEVYSEIKDFSEDLENKINNLIQVNTDHTNKTKKEIEICNENYLKDFNKIKLQIENCLQEVKSIEYTNCKDGNTPQKGLDYFTKQDKDELISELRLDLNAENIRNSLETLEGDDRLDAKFIKNIPNQFWGNGGRSTQATSSALILKTNGDNNGSQSILNLKAGSNVTLSDDGVGGVTISSIGTGGGGSSTYTALTDATTVNLPNINTPLANALNLKQNLSEKNIANGYAGLDATGKVLSAQLPSYVDDVVEFANLAAFPVTGETSKIYVALDTNKTYRWSGSTYVEISPGSNSLTWEKLVLTWSTEPIELATITSGTVLSYTLDSITRYRLIPTTYNPTQDAFYANFDGVTLTNLIVARG